MNKPQHILSAQNRLGETPIWVPDEKALYWVDWGGLPTCRYEPLSKGFTTFPVGPPVSALARRASGGFVAIANDGLYGWDPASNAYLPLVGPADPQNLDICYNDAAVDRQGRLLVGTVDMEDPFRPTGSIFRVDPDFSLHLLDTGYATANGIGFSPDGRTVYVADQRHNKIIALDYDTATGTTSNRRLFKRVPDEEGMPDGLIVDAAGFIWNGHWAGSKLTRYDPEGKIEREIRFPVDHVISFAFGGDDLNELYVTSAWWGFSDEERQAKPWAGDLFLVETDVQGLVEPLFEG